MAANKTRAHETGNDLSARVPSGGQAHTLWPNGSFCLQTPFRSQRRKISRPRARLIALAHGGFAAELVSGVGGVGRGAADNIFFNSSMIDPACITNLQRMNPWWQG